MIEHLASWLLSLANKSIDRRNGKDGLLKIFVNANQVKGTNAVSLDLLIDHCKVPREDMCAAIGSLLPLPGSGKSPYVVIVTERRKNNDAAIAKLKAEVNKATQTEAWAKFLRAAAVETHANLPVFEVPKELVN